MAGKFIVVLITRNTGAMSYNVSFIATAHPHFNCSHQAAYEPQRAQKLTKCIAIAYVDIDHLSNLHVFGFILCCITDLIFT